MDKKTETQTIKTTCGKLMLAAPALSEIAQQAMSVREAYKLSRLIKAVNDEIKLADEQRVKLCQKHGKLDEEKNAYAFEGESAKAFEAELEELFASEVTINAEAVNITSDIKIKPSAISALEDFVIFEGV